MYTWGSETWYHNHLSGPVHTYADRFENANFLCGLPSVHTSDEYGYRKHKLLKTLSRVETFENTNLADTCGRWKRNFSKTLTSRQLSGTWRQTDARSQYNFSRAFGGKPCSVSRDLCRVALCPSGIHEDKAKNVKAIFNASVENLHWRLQRDTRQAKDRRFGVRLARTSAWWNNFTDQVSSRKMCMLFSQLFTRCACSFATGYAWKSNFSDTCGRAKTKVCGYVWTRKLLKTERKACIFKFIRIRVDVAIWVSYEKPCSPYCVME